MMEILTSGDGVYTVVSMLAYMVVTVLAAVFIYYLLRRGKDEPSPRYEPLASNEYHLARQQAARTKLIDEHMQKAETYKEKILEPRKEVKRRKKEDDYLRRTYGVTFLGKGQTLGSENNDYRQPDATENRNRSAAKSRRELEELDPSRNNDEDEQAKDEDSVPLIKKVYTLPDEPPDGCSHQVKVTLRTPQGRFHNRRFLASHHVQDLYDFMTTIGYHQSMYTLLTSYPRRSLHDATDRTLEEEGLVGGAMLNVDLREELESAMET